jgi:hypothetical protein
MGDAKTLVSISGCGCDSTSYTTFGLGERHTGLPGRPVDSTVGDFLGKLCRPCSGKDFWKKLTQKDDKECPQCKKTKSASLFAGKICNICFNTNQRNKMAKKMKTCPQCNKQKSGDRFNGTL